MAVRIVEATHFEAESRARGATTANIKAARSLVQAAIEDRADIVHSQVIRATTEDKLYRPWIRIRGKLSGIRVVVERYQDDEDIVILMHAALLRDEHTYDEVELLWKKYRSKV